MTKSVNDTADFSTEPSVAARCVRRSDSSPADSRNELFSMRSLNGRRMRGTSPTRPAAPRGRSSGGGPPAAISATTMITTIRIGISISHLLWSSRNFGRLWRQSSASVTLPRVGPRNCAVPMARRRKICGRMSVRSGAAVRFTDGTRRDGRCAMGAALVLNATYEPLCVVPLRRAVVLVLAEKAVVVEAGDVGDALRAARAPGAHRRPARPLRAGARTAARCR